ncbi:MAG: hypothetical protein EHM91_01565 [Planctomycetota bacterium]|nr:MAG: hypothetical protein EHM91_01565 [Planctomycetota bacterium]
MTRKRPDWKQVIEGEISDRPRRNILSTRSVGLNVTPEQWKILDRAAERRGMSVAAFLRRAALAVAVHDLGLSWHEVMKDEISPRRHGNARYFNTRENDGGAGHGLWRIREMS